MTAQGSEDEDEEFEEVENLEVDAGAFPSTRETVFRLYCGPIDLNQPSQLSALRKLAGETGRRCFKRASACVLLGFKALLLHYYYH